MFLFFPGNTFFPGIFQAARIFKDRTDLQHGLSSLVAKFECIVTILSFFKLILRKMQQTFLFLTGYFILLELVCNNKGLVILLVWFIKMWESLID